MKLFFKFLLIFFLPFLVNIHANIRMGIISDSNFCGEREFGWRIKIAAESLGWEVFLDETRGSRIHKFKEPDWVICLIPHNAILHPKCMNYLTILHPLNFLDQRRQLLPYYSNYDGYLITINDKESIESSLKTMNKELFSIPFYPTVHMVPYQIVALNNLVTMIPTWGNRLTDKKFRKLYSLLSKSGSVKFYGSHRNADTITDGFMGNIPFDGTSLINILQKHGIVLILHSDIHNAEGIPTSRIFEASAASTVIISDENAFVKKYFGDSVFYIDTSLPAESVFMQIQEHLNNIFSNPEHALEKAKTAHEIFIDNFLMTDQLIKLKAMHQEIRVK